MKKIWSIAVACILVCLVSTSVQAQFSQRGQLTFGLNYNYGLPLGSFKSDMVKDGSPRGLNGELMYGISEKWSAGLMIGYQDFYQKFPRAVYDIDKNQQVSAVLTNSIKTVPVLLKGEFKPLGGSNSFIQPYISAAAGLNAISFHQYLGEFGSSVSSAKFMAQGGLGIAIPFGKYSSSGVQIGATYNYEPYNKDGYNNMNNIGLQAGVHFALK